MTHGAVGGRACVEEAAAAVATRAHSAPGAVHVAPFESVQRPMEKVRNAVGAPMRAGLASHHNDDNPQSDCTKHRRRLDRISEAMPALEVLRGESIDRRAHVGFHGGAMAKRHVLRRGRFYQGRARAPLWS